MISQKEVLSSLTLENLYFESLDFKATGRAETANEKADVAFKMDKPVFSAEKFEVKLYCRVLVDNVFKMELCIVGIFKPSNPESMEGFVPNAVAIMFPYLRSQVSLMTAQPNIPTLVLPSININKLFRDMAVSEKK